MENETPEPDDDPVESLLMAWGLPGFIIGLGVVHAGIFFLWRCLLNIFYPGA